MLVSPHTSQINSVAFSPDNRTFASAGSDGVIVLWDAKTTSQRRLAGHNGPANSLVFSPDGALLVSGGDDKHVRIWDVAAGAQINSLSGVGRIPSVSISSDGNYIASGGDSIRIWRTDGKLLYDTTNLGAFTGNKPAGMFSIPLKITRVAFSTTQPFLAYLDEYGGVWIFAGLEQVLAGKYIRGMLSKSYIVIDNFVLDVKKGYRVLSSDNLRGKTTIFRVSKGEGPTKHPLKGALAFNSTGLSLCVVGEQSRLSLEELDGNGNLIASSFQGHTALIRTLAFGSNSLLATSSNDKTIRFWNVNTKAELGRKLPQQGLANALAFSNNLEYFVAGFDDGTVTLDS